VKKTLLRMVLFVLVFSLVLMLGGVSVFAEGGQPPIISGDTLFLTVGQPFDLMDGISVTDDVDQDLLGKVECYGEVDNMTPGFYWADYFVTDSDGNQTYFNRYIIVLDENLPLIYAYDQKLDRDSSFDPLADVMAYDLKDGDLHHAVEVIENTVDLTSEGEYWITYRVIDSDGYSTELTIWVMVMIPDAERPQIQADRLILKVGDPYDQLAGVTATDPEEGDITDLVKVVESDVNMSQPGIYFAYFEVINAKGISGWGSREIIVVASSSPAFFADDFTIGVGEPLELHVQGICRVYDFEDGDITERITYDATQVDTSAAGTYDLTLRVEDSDGNKAEKTIKVTIIDLSYPQFMMEDFQVILGSDFNPLDYVGVYDQNDPDIMSKVIVVENTVDTSTLGVYSVTYSATNILGHTSVKTVSVEVIPEPVIELFLIYEGQSYLLEMDETMQMIFLEVPVKIPAGALVSLAFYINGELFMEIPDFMLTDEVVPGSRYFLMIGGGEGGEGGEADQTVSPILYPVLSDGAAKRPNAKDAELTFTANVEGTCYYSVVDADADIPEIDTSGEGMPCVAGANELRLTDLDKGEWACYVVLKDAYGHLSEPLRILVPWTPNEPVRPGNKGNHYGHDKNRDAK